MVVMAVCVYKPLNRRWKPSRAEKPEPSARFPVTSEEGGGVLAGFPDQAELTGAPVELHHQRAASPWVIHRLGVICCDGGSSLKTYSAAVWD